MSSIKLKNIKGQAGQLCHLSLWLTEKKPNLSIYVYTYTYPPPLAHAHTPMLACMMRAMPVLALLVNACEAHSLTNVCSSPCKHGVMHQMTSVMSSLAMLKHAERVAFVQHYPMLLLAEHTLPSLVHAHEFCTRTSEAMLLAVARETTRTGDSVRDNCSTLTYVVLVINEKNISHILMRDILFLL